MGILFLSLLSLFLSSSLFPPLFLPSLSNKGISHISPDKATGRRHEGQERQLSGTSTEAVEGAEEADSTGGGSNSSSSGNSSSSRRDKRYSRKRKRGDLRILLIKLLKSNILKSLIKRL